MRLPGFEDHRRLHAMSDPAPPLLRLEKHFGSHLVGCHKSRPRSVHALLTAAVSRNPEGEALVHDEIRLSYAELEEVVACAAGGLAFFGIGRGDRIAIALSNGIPFVVLIYAAARLGAITVPLNIREQTPGLRHALVNSGARLLIADAGLADVMPDASETPHLVDRIFLTPGVNSGESWEALLSHGPLREAAAADEEDTATILYTSGTTGLPKGATLTGLGIVHSAMNYRWRMELTEADRSLIGVPMSHVTGLVGVIHSVIGAAGTIIIDDAFKADRFLALASRERMTHTILVPAMYNLCLIQSDFAKHDLSVWRNGGYGGAPMPPATIARCAEALPDLRLINCYGATETSSPVTFMPPEFTASNPSSIGFAAPGAEVLVMDDEGRELPAGARGELWHRGAMVVPGYWQNEAATADNFVRGFWKSGDIGSKDQDGFLYLHDRKKDVINRGGYKVYSVGVESVLQAMDGVLEAAVIAKPCPVLGERVHAVVISTGSVVDEAELAQRCARKLSDYQCPESFTIRTDPLPRNANGKVLKRELRKALGFIPPSE